VAAPAVAPAAEPAAETTSQAGMLLANTVVPGPSGAIGPEVARAMTRAVHPVARVAVAPVGAAADPVVAS